MSLNVSKCKVMSFTRKPSISEFSYSINHSILSTATQYRYLGVILTPNLSWSDHIRAISANASKSLGYLRCNLKTAPSSIRKLSYLTLVRIKYSQIILLNTGSPSTRICLFDLVSPSKILN
uniref:Sphingosine kinase n=1 Tax=Rhipicephalus appendiculatus TaxID=34631 RepID=A0A131YXY4_RHIAP